MIQLSSLSGTVPANPTKAALPGAGEGVFGDLLEGEIGQDSPRAPATPGNDLPDTGKSLPLAGNATLPLKIKLLIKLDETTAEPEPLPVEDHGTMPVRDSDEGPAEDMVAPAKFFLDPMIPFAAPPSASIVPEAAGKAEEAVPSGRAGPKPQLAKAELLAKPDTQPLTSSTDAKSPAPLPTVEIPQDIATQPADPRLARLVSVARPAAAREFRIELGTELRGLAPTKLADAPKGEKPISLLPVDLGVGTASADSATAPQGVAATRQAGDPSAALRPHDFTALIDRLVEARDAAKPHAATMALMHAEFGEVSLRFSQQDGALSVTMSSQDPEFKQAVNAAMPAERSQNDGSGQPNNNQGNRRDDAAGQTASSGASNSDPSGQDSQSRQGHEAGRDAIDQDNPGTGLQTLGRTRDGIFA